MTTPANEYHLGTCTVYVDGTLTTALRCTQLELSTGEIPSRAMLMQINGRDVQGPVALNPTTGFSYGQRVRIDVAEGSGAATTLFCGWLLKRSDQCRADKIIWQAFDDRILLQWIAVRGAVVYDPITKALRYSPRHPTRFNPDGFWNCTGVTYDGETYPVFTNVSCRSQAYESPEASYPKAPTIGQYNPWTPRRALWYLKLWATAGTNNWITALDTSLQSFLSLTGPMYIQYDDIEKLVGTDPAGGADPLDRKIQDLTVQGGSLLNAFGKVLKTAGTHSLAIGQVDGTPGESILGFKKTGYTDPGVGDDIIVQRGGVVGELGAGVVNCWDFNFDEDASQVSENMLVEGDAVRVESRLTFYTTGRPTGGDYSEDTTSDIIPAWNYDQEVAYLECIHGGPPSSPADTYAKIARNHGDPTVLDVCDGTVATGHYPQIIYARSPQAVQAARDSFPTVFRAWKLNCRSTNMQHLLGLANGDVGGLQGARPIMDAQLQFLIRNLGGGTGVENWLLTKLPIRARIWNDTAGAYYEVPKDIGIRVTPDGLIWLDGLGDQASPSSDCFINGDLTNIYDYADSRIVLRKMELNCAFPTDTRLYGFKYLGPVSGISSSLRDVFDGATLGRYQDAGQSFHRGIQHVSDPCLSPAYYGGANGLESLTAPLSRDVPPGSEKPQADLAAQRTLSMWNFPHRSATFTMIGIQKKWTPGDRIAHVILKTPPSTDTYYTLYSAYHTVVHDFLRQETIICGLLSIYSW